MRLKYNLRKFFTVLAKISIAIVFGGMFGLGIIILLFR